MNGTIGLQSFCRGCAGFLSVWLAGAAHACGGGAVPIFACDVAGGRKFIELCAPSPSDAGPDFLVYRFGSLGKDGAAGTIELEFPPRPEASMQRFYGATYTHRGVYTQSVRFVSGQFSYTVFTRAQGTQELDAGVEVVDRVNGRKRTVSCGERPRFYIFDLKGRIPCDPETPVGRACVK